MTVPLSIVALSLVAFAFAFVLVVRHARQHRKGQTMRLHAEVHASQQEREERARRDAERWRDAYTPAG